MQGPIAIDYTAALTQGGGIGRYTRELIKALAQQDQNTDYRLFAAGFSPDALPPSPGRNFTWTPSRISPIWFARFWHRLRTPITIERWTGSVKLLHAPDFTLPPTRHGTRTILTVHDLSFVREPDTFTGSLRAYLNSVVPRSIQRADLILADSEATRQDIIDIYHTPEAKIRVLYSGVDDHFYPVHDLTVLSQMREKYRIGSGPYILSVGTVQPRKNYARLIEAFHRLNMPDMKLIIAGGKGWLDAPLYTRVAELHLQDRVQFLGFTPDEDLPALYSAARMFAYPALYEGFGLPPLEAMACGVPVLASNRSSLPEVVGTAAVIVEPLDIDAIVNGLRQILEDNSLRKILINRSQLQVQKFNWQNAARKLRETYEEVLEWSNNESSPRSE
jgi:glycosyltransferase involved in cell wall biosynthesis